MSWEAWGSNEPPTHWEGTAQKQEFDQIVSKWTEWLKLYNESADDKLTIAVADALDDLGLSMEGRL